MKIGRGNRIVYSEEDYNPYLQPRNIRIFKIQLDEKKFVESVASGALSESSPLEMFKELHPRITSEEIKREIKGRMSAEYRGIIVSLDEARENLEREWKGQ